MNNINALHSVSYAARASVIHQSSVISRQEVRQVPPASCTHQEVNTVRSLHFVASSLFIVRREQSVINNTVTETSGPNFIEIVFSDDLSVLSVLSMIVDVRCAFSEPRVQWC